MTDDRDDWKESYSAADEWMTIEMPAADACKLRRLAKQAGLSVENYLRQSLGFTLVQ